MTEPGDVRVLGPVEATGPAGPMVLHGSRQRAVLGVLALHAGTVLPVARLVDLLWGNEPPRTSVRTVHSHVARIRQALEECGFPPILVTKGNGYVLDIRPEMVDAHRFESQVRAARKDIAAGAVDRAATTLRRVLALWRGDAFVDAALTGWGAAEIDRLHETRLSALEDLWDCLLRLGEHEDAVRELPRLLATHPTRERLAGLHMLALYRCGRHTDALESFHRLRRGLADEFGVDPGPELLALHTSILRRDPGLDPRPSSGGPAQLPARVGHFTGRAEELASLDRVLDVPDGEWPVVLISGAAGMGKTALAVQWAHTVAARFPDGQLFVDLRGHDPRHALSATEALAHLLRSLGVVDERLPGEPAERAALYRSLLHDRRCVIVLDNAPAVEDVLPLVPGTGPALLLVTSRHSGAALGSRHAVHPIALDALDQASSLALLTRVLGADLVARQSGPSARLVRLCGGMPLALRIAAARLVGKPDRAVGELAAELAGTDGLDTLAVEGDSRTVRAVLASAYRPLDPAAGMMFRRLGLSPGSTVSAALGAALCGVPIEQGRRAAERLASAHLVSANGPDRFRFHDLTRGFARQVARTDDAATLAETVDRLIDWYLVVAAGANHAIDADRDLVTPTLRHPPPELPFSADRHTALAFLSTERDNLLPVVRYAVEHGRPAAAWQLTYLLTGFYDATGHWHERVELCRQGAAAAAALGDPLAQAEMLRALGVAYFMVRRMEDALAANAAALRVAEASGDLNGEGHIHNNMANAYVELRRFDEAITAHRMAVDRSAAAGNRLGHALAQRNLGYTYVRMGRAEDSLAPLTAALAAFRDLGNDRLAAATLDTLGEAHLELGQHHLALVHLDEAVSVSRDIGDRWMESESLLDAGVVRLGLGDSTAALADFEQALTISREVGDRHGEASALRRIGRVHLGTGDLDAARADLRSAVAVRAEAPDDYQEAHLYRDLAEVEERSGWPELSAAHRARAITLYRQANAMAEADALATAARR